jgi:hypothetical protein
MFSVKDILSKCSYDGCCKSPNEWGCYCDVHNIVVNIDNVIYNRNPNFQFKDLLNLKLKKNWKM